jgi:hypothetical protein
MFVVVYFTAIWCMYCHVVYLLRHLVYVLPCGVFYGHLVYVLPCGIFVTPFGVLFSVLVCCATKNLATLELGIPITLSVVAVCKARACAATGSSH